MIKNLPYVSRETYGRFFVCQMDMLFFVSRETKAAPLQRKKYGPDVVWVRTVADTFILPGPLPVVAESASYRPGGRREA